mmetsp:Transcript_86427/g.180955  ORF Transcript_86427/g.180955 Transcript_86427/m.180955 type:complete len:281 (-) Transcript_86427:8-850(-)
MHSPTIEAGSRRRIGGVVDVAGEGSVGIAVGTPPRATNKVAIVVPSVRRSENTVPSRSRADLGASAWQVHSSNSFCQFSDCRILIHFCWVWSCLLWWRPCHWRSPTSSCRGDVPGPANPSGRNGSSGCEGCCSWWRWLRRLLGCGWRSRFAACSSYSITLFIRSWASRAGRPGRRLFRSRADGGGGGGVGSDEAASASASTVGAIAALLGEVPSSATPVGVVVGNSGLVQVCDEALSWPSAGDSSVLTAFGVGEPFSITTSHNEQCSSGSQEEYDPRTTS